MDPSGFDATSGYGCKNKNGDTVDCADVGGLGGPVDDNDSNQGKPQTDSQAQTQAATSSTSSSSGGRGCDDACQWGDLNDLTAEMQNEAKGGGLQPIQTDHHILQKIKGGDLQGAIDLAAKLHGLKGGTFDPNEKGEGRTDTKGNISLGPRAFYPDYEDPKRTGAPSASWLVSTLDHENAHLDQRGPKNYRFGIGQGGTINQVEAYRRELDHADKNGLTSHERQLIEGRLKGEMRELFPKYREQVQGGDYSVPDIYLVPR